MTVALTDNTGTVQTSYTYDPFGNPSSSGTSSGNTQQYTGRENDGTGLQYNRARYYSPTLQRFISEDPLGFGGGDTNLYAYVGNDPINATDPSGACPLCVVVAGACLVGAVAGGYHGWKTAGRKDEWTNAANDAVIGCALGTVTAAAAIIGATAVITALGGGAAVIGATAVGAAVAGAGAEAESGGANEAASAAESGGRGLDVIQGFNNRAFSRFLSSVQTQAAQAGHATRDAQETQEILDEAQRRGYTLVRPGEKDWVGGLHGHLIGPQGQNFHFPFPPDFSP